MAKQVKCRQDYLPPDFTITDIALDIDLNEQKTTVKSVMGVKRLNVSATSLVLDGEALTLDSLHINGQDWQDYQVTDSTLVINQVPSEFTLTIINTISPMNNTALEGLYVSDGALCTQCEAEGFRRITYYLDRPDVLARFTTRLTADKARYPYLLSNGNRMNAGELAEGRHWVEWQDPFPKPAYLFALVAGDFDRLQDEYVTGSGKRVSLELYVDKGNLDRATWAMACLKQSMQWDEKRFGLEYDLGIYMIVAVDFFNMGAMENKGLNIFNSKYVLANAQTATDRDYLNIQAVIGHEYFHNWTGNRVTCRDWFQLSLKEGLTVFRDQEFSSDVGSRGVNRIHEVRVLRSAQFAEDASPMAHPIRPEKVQEMNNFYTVTVYEKGAEVIRMMHTLLGEAGFQAGMKLYFQRYDGQAVTCDDFVQAMQDASGIDLTLFKRWYSQSGTPQVTASDAYDAEQKRYTLTLKQMTPPTLDQAEKQPLLIPLAIAMYRQDGSAIALQSSQLQASGIIALTEVEQTFVFDSVDEKPVISLLQNFSAPIRLNYNYTDDELILLMQHASDDFTRWDAAQLLINRTVIDNVKCVQAGKEMTVSSHVIDAFRAVLLSTQLDHALMAEILTLPTETELAEQFEQIDVDAIHQVRNHLIDSLAVELENELLNVYLTNKTDSTDITQLEMGKRALANVCLSYLAHVKTVFVENLVEMHYIQATNMTNALAGLSAANAVQSSSCASLMKDFEQKWQNDGLVMDKWFILQATSSKETVLDTVKSLMDHPAFSLSNPNRVRSLIGSFVMQNPFAFHNTNGAGYQFLTEILIKLNESNPQVASRLVEPLVRLKRYDEKRQTLMRRALETLKALPHLSPDLAEKVDKALL